MGSTLMVDAPWYVDLAVALCLVLSAGINYTLIGMNGNSLGRWLSAVGWTGLSARMLYGLLVDGNVPIASISMPFLAMAAGGTVIGALRHMRESQADVKCLRDPWIKCQRSDRVEAALAKIREKEKRKLS
jgi:hypothetical protein